MRPEWGLAGNAAFIVAPRERSRHIDLEGRAFLHDYRFEDDKDHAILEAIMTGPLVVAHWINFQYYASTVDNARYGCGNKVLHNIVGGHLGVFEGNGGDLRIGLSLQSLHDGERWVHAPLRLAVFIEAPRAGDRSRAREAPQGARARRQRVAPPVPARRDRAHRLRAHERRLEVVLLGHQRALHAWILGAALRLGILGADHAAQYR